MKLSYLQKLIISFALLLWISIGNIVAQEVTYKHFSFNNGLPSATIYYILQDQKGFIWFGTDAGVSRFDGNKFVNYTMSEGLSENEILSIGEDSMGRIWFLGFNGTVSYYHSGKIHNSSNDILVSKIPNKGTLQYFYEDAYHRIWFSTLDGYIILDNKDVKFELASAIPYVGGGLVYSNNKKEVNKIHNFHKAYCYLPNKTLLFYKTDSVLLASNNSIELVLQLNKQIANHVITGLTLSEDNKLWISTGGNGVFCYDGKDYQKPPEQYLDGKVLSCITYDKEGNIWVGSINDGVYMLQPWYEKARTYNSSNSPLQENIYSVIISQSGDIYAGMDSGKVCKINTHGVEVLPILNEGFIHNRITSIKVVDDDFFIGSDKGIIHYSPTKGLNHYIKFSSSKHRSDARRAVKDICLTNQGIGVCEGYSVGIFETDKNIHHEIELINKFDSSLIRKYSIFATADNTIWYSAAGGLYAYNGKTIKHHPEINKYAQEKITDINQTNDGTLVLATYGNGILFYKNNSVIYVLNKEKGLSNNICKRIAINNDIIYVATANGVSFFEYKAGKIKELNYYTTSNGLASNNVNDIYADDSVICVATSGGLTVLNALTKIKKNTPPLLYITTAKCLDQQISTDSTYSFGYKKNSLHFNYIAISYRAPESIQYKYRLNSKDEWMYTRNTSVDLLYLPDGKYQFELSARVLDSDWSIPVSFSFTIKPPFWRTYFFYASCVIGLILVLFILLRYRNRKAETKRNEELKIKNQIVLLEQQALQAMMNPHFIFNVMNTIQQAINNSDAYKANVYLSDFAKLIRLNLDISVRSAIPLEEEISYLELYLSLEKIRFGDRLSYNISVDKDIDEYETLIPVMLLQPFIENAIWHGILPLSTNGHVQINIIKAKKDYLQITITDNGKGRHEASKSAIIQVKSHISRGMTLTKQRLELIGKITQKEVSLEITDAYPEQVNKGTLVKLLLPSNLVD